MRLARNPLMNTQCVGDEFYVAELTRFMAVALDGAPH